MSTLRDGKQLEQLVAFVEETLVPAGFEVKHNTKVFDEDGNQLAEFDIEVRGKVGTRDIAWLIECRDRPSDGAAPGSWIDQLAGRRDRFKFSEVTAVSTTGFSVSARDSAKRHGIELREVNAIDPKEFLWLQMEHLSFQERVVDLKAATINIVEELATDSARIALTATLKANTSETKFLCRETGEAISIRDLYAHMVKDAWGDIEVGAPARELRLLANFKEEDRLFVNTPSGQVPVGSVAIVGAIRIRETLIRPTTTKYHDPTSGNVFSEIVQFPLMLGERQFDLEMHRITGADAMPIVLRPRAKTEP